MNKYPNPYSTCQQVGKFSTVSKENYEQIAAHFQKEAEQNHVLVPKFVPYEDLKLPVRKTEDSAGYDFFLPQDVHLFSGESILIPTFMRCFIKHGWALFIYPRSSYGFKYNMRLANTVGIVDADYFKSKTEGPDNEGHIMIKLVNDGRNAMNVHAGDRFCQGIFQMYGVTFSDDMDEKDERNGGVGSTGN